MNRIQLVAVLYESAVRGCSDSDRHRQHIIETVARLVGCLERWPGMKLGLYVTSGTLDRLAEEGSGLSSRVRQAVSSGQLELLGGTCHAAVLTATPGQDVAYQLGRIARQVEQIGGRPPAGIWLPLGIWEPALPMMLARCGVRYTFLDSEQIAARVGAREDIAGPWMVEKLGFRVHLLATDRALSDRWTTCPTRDFLAELKQRTLSSVRLAVVAQELEVLEDVGECCSWLSDFAALGEDNEHWLESCLPAQALEKLPSLGRVSSPLPVTPEVAARALPPGTYRELIGGPDFPDDTRDRGPFEPKELAAGMATWDMLLERYPEGDLIHKKMLWTSTWVHRIADLARKKHREGQDTSVLAAAFERAQRSLFAAQSHVTYWPGPGGGLYSPEVRQDAFSHLLEAQKRCEAVFFPEPRWVSHQEVDLDRDGSDEVIVSTPAFSTICSLRGGGVLELSYKPVPMALFSLANRREELEHGEIPKSAVSVSSRGLDGGERSCDTSCSQLESRLRYDRYMRKGFLDHFLGSDATVDNFYQCQYPECGDFLEGAYEIIRVAYERKSHQGVLHLSRNGHVGEPASGGRSALRVEKKFIFDDLEPKLTIQYQLTNRGQEPVSFRFGTELGLASPLEPESWISDPKAGDTRPFVKPPVTTGAARGSLGPVAGWLCRDSVRDLAVRVSLGTPTELWWFDLETITRIRGEMTVLGQGTIFLPTWQISLWGLEAHSLTIVLEVVDVGGGQPVVDVIDSNGDENGGSSSGVEGSGSKKTS